MRRNSVRVLAASALLLVARTTQADDTLVLDGEVPDDASEFFYVPFDVPEGTAEIEVRHDDLSEENILDWGLYEPSGAFRGWGGGNAEPAVVTELAASRSYLIGPLPSGEWNVVVGKAKIKETPALYHIEVDLQDAPTLPAQPERAPYEAAPALSTEARWYAGDFHVHSRESGDARESMTLDEIASFAKDRGLDFVALSDHNTVAQLDFLGDAQARQRDFLLLPSVEFTTYAGHANGIGATAWVDHKIGFEGATIEAAAKAFADQGAIFSINHPALDVGDLCIGCAWDHDLSPESVGAVEIATGGLAQGGTLFTPNAIAFWEELCATGRHIPAVGGSDDHRAGQDLSGFQSPIGDPTTLVYATELSTAGILEGIKNGRTVVKLQGPDDPMLEVEASVAPAGDSITAARVTLRARVTHGDGTKVRFVKNGQPEPEVTVVGDDFVHEAEALAPAEGEDRWRAEVLVEDDPRTVSSYLWLKSDGTDPTGPAGNDPAPLEPGGGGCGCALPNPAPRSAWLAAALSLLALLSRRRRRP